MILNRDLSGSRGNENALKLKGLEIMPSYMYLFLFLAKGFIKESDYVMLAEATSKNNQISIIPTIIFFFTKYKEYKYPELEMFFSRIVESVYYYNGPHEEKYIVIVLARENIQ